MKKIIHSLPFKIALYICAAVGVVFILVYILLELGLLNVKGSISSRNEYFNYKKSESAHVASNDLDTVCKINTLSRYAPLSAINIYATLRQTGSDPVIDQMIETASRHFASDARFQAEMNDCNTATDTVFTIPTSAYVWQDSDEWAVMRDVFTRDQDIIIKAAKDAGVSPRLILSCVVGEQFRFFESRREAFKSYFEPLKILASLSNTSYGIAGIKPKTVTQIEANLHDPKSKFYPGPEYEHIADHPQDVDVATDQMNRITDAKNPYYSYLYVGLYIKELETQWKNAGYDITNRPDVIATLYNLGFYYSVPKADPQAGGANITVNGADYTYGDLGYEFYYSGELSEIFPLNVQ